MKKTPYYSYKSGNLAIGCKLCTTGSKLVLFVTGLCPRCCYYCPISDQKYKKDVIYADEWKISKEDDIIEEAKLIDAEGAGITGGDPLCKLERTIRLIRKLKKEFGKKFHVHLYTSLDLVDSRIFNKLYNAGLDEIRFHLDIDNDKLWNKIKLALEFSWDTGVEIPAIPGKLKQYKRIIRFLDSVNNDDKITNRIKFINLNELEVADNSVNELISKGFKTKDQLSYGIKGSEELALKILSFIEKKEIKLNVHYCTAALKDRIQLANRIKRRAKNVAYSFDIITEEGLLKRGVIYFAELKPAFSYSGKINMLRPSEKRLFLLRLRKMKKKLIGDLGFQNKDIEIDVDKLRLLLSQSNVKKYHKQIKKKGMIPALIEEYPTKDGMIVELDMF